MTSTVETKLNKVMDQLDEYRPDQAAILVKMQKTLKTAMLKKNFGEHPAIVMLLDALRKREEAYTLILANKEDLESIKRQGYFDRRKEVRFILSFFDVDKTIQGIEAQIDYQLSDSTGDNREA